MKKMLLVVLSAGLLAYFLYPQWRSFERMGLRRFEVLRRQPKEIVVGAFWPFSTNEDGMADGLQLARDEINSRGLAGGIQVKLVIRDDTFNWEKAKNVAVEFSDTPSMSAVLGYYDDSEAIKASGMYEAARLLHLMTGVNNTAMTTHGYQYMVRTILSSNKIARALAKMAMDRGLHRVAVIWEEGGYGEDLAYQFRVALDALGGELAYQWSYSRERADFRNPANELKGVDADLIFFAGLEPWAGNFLRMARTAGIKTEILGAFSDTPLMRSSAGSAREGAMFFDFYDVNAPGPENQEFVRKFRSRYKRDPDSWAAQGYDALRILANAVKATGSVNPLDLSYAIRYMDPWEGANGRYKFDARGELEEKPLYLIAYRNGEPVVIQTTTPDPAPLVH